MQPVLGRDENFWDNKEKNEELTTSDKEVYLLKRSLSRLSTGALSFDKPVYQSHGEIEGKDTEHFLSRREEF